LYAGPGLRSPQSRPGVGSLEPLTVPAPYEQFPPLRTPVSAEFNIRRPQARRCDDQHTPSNDFKLNKLVTPAYFDQRLTTALSRDHAA